MKRITDDCYLDSDSMLDMACGKSPDGSILITFKGDTMDHDAIVTLSPEGAEWLEKALRHARGMK